MREFAREMWETRRSQVQVPWAEGRGDSRPLFERLAIDVPPRDQRPGATEILRISWDEAWGIQQRAVERGLAAKETRTIAAIGVDEKAVAKGQRYMTWSAT